MRELSDKVIDSAWSLEAEAGVLGSMLLEQSCIAGVLAKLSADSFQKIEHRHIFAAIERLHSDSEPVDCIALRTQLTEDGHLDDAGGVEYIEKILESVPHTANVEYYTGVVEAKERYRALIRATEQMQDVLAEPLGVDEQIQKIRDLALDIEPTGTNGGSYDMRDCATVGAMAFRDDAQRAFHTGFGSVDKLVGGVTRGDLIIIAGRPSMGKTSLALDFALRAAQDGRSVVFFTLEMTAYALIQRACSNMGRVDLAEIRVKSPEPEVMERYCEASFNLKELPLVICEDAVTPAKQLAFVKAQKKLRSVDIVVVDYLQLMSARGRNESRQQEITTISRKLKRLAIDEKVLVVALSQLNRQVEGREKHRPRMSDLRESGSLEQDADVVMLLHREDYYRRSDSPDSYTKDGSAELIIAKNRQGATGIAGLCFIEKHTRFGELCNA